MNKPHRELNDRTPLEVDRPEFGAAESGGRPRCKSVFVSTLNERGFIYVVPTERDEVHGAVGVLEDVESVD
jgi:hypothetical protein